MLCGCKSKKKRKKGETLYTCVMQHLESLWDLIAEYILEGLTRLGQMAKTGHG